jgi:hypothetical protein
MVSSAASCRGRWRLHRGPVHLMRESRHETSGAGGEVRIELRFSYFATHSTHAQGRR